MEQNRRSVCKNNLNNEICNSLHKHQRETNRNLRVARAVSAIVLRHLAVTEMKALTMVHDVRHDFQVSSKWLHEGRIHGQAPLCFLCFFGISFIKLKAPLTSKSQQLLSRFFACACWSNLHVFFYF